MKPPGFTYHRPQTVEEALDVLAEVGPEGKVIAGGQSLVPMMNMRLAAPQHLVDINHLPDLGFVQVEGQDDGRSGVRVGATARHADVERDHDAGRAVPLLQQALACVAHPTIRNRGTTVGSLVHADPAGELTAVLALLGGSVELRSTRGTRTVPATEFFVGLLESCVEPDELATSALFPVPVPRTGSSWVEVARRNGDYALCGVGALVTIDDDRRVRAARTAYVSVGPTPVVLDVTDELDAAPLHTADWATVGRWAAEQLTPGDDIHATAHYRKHLAAVLTERALREAAGRAERGESAESAEQIDGATRARRVS
ncbi:FAD binding domain-containing protein [Phytoactinopolyspora halotolerans]|uniref:Xanthine dehydrogenase family protein subunit M n=1 Tax=Phytoactinopolyspora halotolerans TaxID=1981512 RepID=A0A6L9SAR1_9ACTN|nr:xanthine dehydrogenase family protein subunit M [Phytoactinopolyspora halotolerans]NEE02133.1 xanthine dehydrogenase family protein subunit M [Phytoactinopolyspora halotolerans]